MAPWSTKKRVTFWRKKKKPVVAEVAEEKAEAAEFSGGSSTTETKKRITTKSNVKQVRFSEKDAEAEEEVVVRDNMAEKNRLKASDVAKKEAVGGGGGGGMKTKEKAASAAAVGAENLAKKEAVGGGGMEAKEKAVDAAAVGAENLAKKEAVGGGGMKTKEKAASAAAVGAENLAEKEAVGGGGMEAKEKAVDAATVGAENVAKKEAVVGRRMEVKEKAVAAAAVGAETTGGITVTEMQGKNTTKRDVTLKELEVAKAEVAAHNSTKSAMITQALALAEEEAVGGTGATLGDMEVALRSIKKPSPVPSPSQHTDIHGNGSVGGAQGQRKDGGASSVEQKDTPLKSKSSVEILSSRSPTSQFEYDIMDATHKTLDIDYLHRSRSFPLLDDNKSISSEESMQGRDDDEKSFLSDGVATQVSTMTKAQDKDFSCVETVFSPMDCAADFAFCQMKCAFPNMVEDMNEIMSSDLHHLVFGGEDGAEVEALFPLNENAGEGGNQGEGGVGSRFKNFSYRPSAGFVLRADGRLSVLSKDKVLIRVDATTITTRDCLEKLRRDSIKELKDEAWVPGHEIVGHVVCAGANAKFLLDKRVAAVLPHGGGCSQYICIDAKYVIALPQEAGSTNDVIALLSSYVTAHQCLESFVGTEPEEDEDVESNVESKEAVDAGQEQEKSRLFGKNVLIVGAVSPIGRALVDLATNAGATVYNESHLSHLSTMLWGSQMDLVVDTIGNPDNNPSFYKVMKARARLVRVNITSCGKRYEPLVETTLFGFVISSRSPLAEKDKSYYGRVINDKAINYDVFHSFNEDKESFTEDLVYLLDLLKNGKIRPNKISRTGFANLEGDWEKVMTGKGKNGGIVLVSPWSQKQAQFENASYSPSTGFILRADARLPELLEDEVLIRVDATTITTRDCLERLRRDRTEELKEEDWVPGHEIVGHVVRAGANAKFLSDKRVAAVLPHGGGCSQYMCIDAKDVVALPEEVGSTKDMIALLSTYMTAHQCLKSVAAIEPEESPRSTLAACGAWLQPLSRTETEKEMIADDAGQEQERSRLFGKKVLIVGAGSSVGLALVDLARNAGATVHTVSHRSHLDAIREMGAHYWYPSYQKNLWESKWGGEMDLIVDTIGDPNNNPSFYKVMKTRARLVRVNVTSCEKKYVQHVETTQVGFGIFDSSYYIKDKVIDYDIFNSFNEDKESFTEDLAYLLGLTKTGKIRPKFFSQVGFGKLGGEWEKLMAGTSGVVLVLP